MAIGLADGQVLLHNLEVDKTVVKFKQDYGPVTSIGFRTGELIFIITCITTYIFFFLMAINLCMHV